MKISKVAELLKADICCGKELVENEVHSACGSDMMSDVLAFVKDQAVLLTGLGVYDKIAKHAGAGTLVPITGFANAVSSPAIEFKAEGFITGLGAKLFIIAGPVIVYGVSASIIYGAIYWVTTLF